MTLTNLDILVRRGLLEAGLPIHYYFEYLLHSSTCIRELSFDTLKIVNTVELPISEIGAVDVPNDYVDDVALCISNNGILQPLPHQKYINPMRSHNATTGAFEKPENISDSVENNYFWGSAGWMWFWNVNEFGEPTGRFFGANGGTSIGYKFVKERRQIQMSGGFDSGRVVLQYISDGQNVDNASQIDVQAFQCIRSWQEWKKSSNANNGNSPEALLFYNEKKKLRARISGMSLVDVKNVIRNSYTASIKN